MWAFLLLAPVVPAPVRGLPGCLLLREAASGNQLLREAVPLTRPIRVRQLLFQVTGFVGRLLRPPPHSALALGDGGPPLTGLKGPSNGGPQQKWVPVPVGHARTRACLPVFCMLCASMSWWGSLPFMPTPRIGLTQHAWLGRDRTELPSMVTGYLPSAALRGPQTAILPFRPSRVPSNPRSSTCLCARGGDGRQSQRKGAQAGLASMAEILG